MLLVADVDHFKAYNDAYGHGAGDRMPEARGARHAPVTAGRGASRPPWRRGIPRHSSPAPIPTWPPALAESLRRAVRQLGIAHGFTGDRNKHVTISVGAACGAIETDGDFDRLLDIADRALYAAKGDGRNAWRVSMAEDAEAGGGLRVWVG
ncbi:MAG: GGDEF domain-containing protein [Rhizobium sp.]|nr:GGDEF domain-containing protein [Rhizobium sp.]